MPVVEPLPVDTPSVHRYALPQTMFLRHNRRFKDGKEHRYPSVVENRRVSAGRSVQKTLLYLGEINDSERASWTRAIGSVDESDRPRLINLFPEDRTLDPALGDTSIRLNLGQIELARPRQWGACWLALELWDHLRLLCRHPRTRGAGRAG